LGTNNLVAIEIKGGYDKSNQHNRIGEAEKSHRKAKDEGYKDFWTLIRTGSLDMDKARIQSPTTSTWFDTAQIIAGDGQDWELFRETIAYSIGITLP
jgi:hypothetical protein